MAVRKQRGVLAVDALSADTFVPLQSMQSAEAGIHGMSVKLWYARFSLLAVTSAPSTDIRFAIERASIAMPIHDTISLYFECQGKNIGKIYISRVVCL